MEHYNTGIKSARNRDPLVENLEISEEARDALVAFMEALTDTSYLKIPQVLSPF